MVILTEFMTGVFVRFDLVEGRQIRSALSAVKIAYLPVTEPIAVEAAPLRARRPARGYACRRAPAKKLRAVYRLRTPNALHVATALAGRVLVTNDRRLDRVAAEGVSPHFSHRRRFSSGSRLDAISR